MKAEFNDVEIVFTRTVCPGGHSGRINIPPKYVGKTVFVVVVDENKEMNKQ